MMDDLNQEISTALAKYLTAMADDELVLAHRNSEWTGHAPILEEDIAFSNIAQDEMGHAMLWYGQLYTLTGLDPDRLVFFRSAGEFRNVQMVELPKGDWAFTILRQYLFDAYELINLKWLERCPIKILAEPAAKIRREEIYHFRHSSAWTRRLGLGTGESNRRMQRALEELWPYAGQLFRQDKATSTLVMADSIPDPAGLWLEWQTIVVPFLTGAGLKLPGRESAIFGSRNHHTEHLVDLLGDLQEVARSDPEASW
jgi:ring-1,2-phenylacetyl-CoA epoxidase subunit PaaC